MKQFFNYVFASIIGFFISLALIFILFFVLLSALISSAVSEGEGVVKENTVLKISLNYPINERGSSSPFGEALDLYNMKAEKKLGLDDILARIDAAKENNSIKGIYLNMSSLGANFATAQEIRDALLDFKESGKFVIAYSEYYSQMAYYLASAADKVYLHPEGSLDFKGLSSQVMFFKDALDKLGIDAQIIRVGTYKSAIEPFILDKMSDANRLQVTSYLGSMNKIFMDNIAKSRNIGLDSLQQFADDYVGFEAGGALRSNLIDSLKYKDEILDELAQLLGTNDSQKINSLSLENYVPEGRPNTAKDRIAIIYADGEIVSGEGSQSTVGSATISRAIRKAREDNRVKAVVLRVNSPGGDAVASDVIWREVALCKLQKPIIASMGDMAASGGYYISCAADSIFAQPNTITGSIGVFGIVPNMSNFLNSKLGIHLDGVKTAKYADFGDVSRPLTSEERFILQQHVNRTYSVFTKRVADGRNLSQAAVDSIGQGRVWTGQQALENGLVDRVGSMQDAVAAAASKAGIDAYRLVSYPAAKSRLELFLSSSSDDVRSYFTKKELGEVYPYYKQMKDLLQLRGIQARIPYDIVVQ